MLQYLQSWFPGWGGWSGQQTPEGKLGEGLSAEQHEQWTPEEILGKVVAGLHISPPGCSGGRCLVHLSVLLLTRPTVFFKQKQVDVCRTVHLMFLEAEKGCFGRDFICGPVTKFEY